MKKLLLPCDHPYSAFAILLEELDGKGYLSNEIVDNCFFLIRKYIDFEYFNHRKIYQLPYSLDYELRPVDESDAVGDKKEIDITATAKPTPTPTEHRNEKAKNLDTNKRHLRHLNPRIPANPHLEQT
ncbi:MAG: hypothetical protein Q8Q50_02230 [Methylobacter sp.]|nr:hypothetical protein [Methylobacter sp.]